MHEEHPFYGVKRLAICLGWSEEKARRIRKLAGVEVERSKKKPRYLRSKAEIPAPANQLQQYAEPKNQLRPQDGMNYVAMTSFAVGAWVQDFTYIWIVDHFCYFAVVLELATRQILGWSFGIRHTAELTYAALCDALSRRQQPRILHSDQGSEYLSARHEKLCVERNITLSASDGGKPWQNGYMESWFSRFKSEVPELLTITTEAEMYERIARAVYYYNHQRIHTSLKMPPAVYAQIATEARVASFATATHTAPTANAVCVGYAGIPTSFSNSTEPSGRRGNLTQ